MGEPCQAPRAAPVTRACRQNFLRRPRWRIVVDWVERGRLRHGVVLAPGWDLAGVMRLKIVDAENSQIVYVDPRLVRPVDAWAEDDY